MLTRRNSPVFVLGCHRSGTNLMYDTLMSAGSFAVHRPPFFAYESLRPRYGSFARRANREKLIKALLDSRAFRCSGLDPVYIRSVVVEKCRTTGDFLCIMMGELSRLQNAERWAVWSPDNVLHIPHIKREIPDALFLHVVRDGRDVALALTKMKGLWRFPWDKKRAFLTAALFWQWMARYGRKYGGMFPSDYLEVHFEDLVRSPRDALAQVSKFIGDELDYDRIRRVGLGAVAHPNSTFGAELENGDFDPIGRWKKYLSGREVLEIECLTGKCLKEFGYELTTRPPARPALAARITTLYPRVVEVKKWLKHHTLLGRLAIPRGFEVEPQYNGKAC
jgi:hypothetical protein